MTQQIQWKPISVTDTVCGWSGGRMWGGGWLHHACKVKQSSAGISLVTAAVGRQGRVTLWVKHQWCKSACGSGCSAMVDRSKANVCECPKCCPVLVRGAIVSREFLKMPLLGTNSDLAHLSSGWCLGAGDIGHRWGVTLNQCLGLARNDTQRPNQPTMKCDVFTMDFDDTNVTMATHSSCNLTILK